MNRLVNSGYISVLFSSLIIHGMNQPHLFFMSQKSTDLTTTGFEDKPPLSKKIISRQPSQLALPNYIATDVDKEELKKLTKYAKKLNVKKVNKITSLINFTNCNYSDEVNSLLCYCITSLYVKDFRKTCDIVQSIIDRMPDADCLLVTTRDGKQVTHWTAIKDAYFLFDIFLGKGIGVDVVDDEGMTPLHYAAIGGNVTSVRTLATKWYADPHKITRDGKNTIQLTQEKIDYIHDLLNNGQSSKSEKKQHTEELKKYEEIMSVLTNPFPLTPRTPRSPHD